jgi:hypothetical protein
MKRLDTKLFSNGAEFLVMSKLLLTNIQTYKAYVNFEGYDLVCTNPTRNLSAKIQVKSKNFIKDTGFYLNKGDKAKPDFYVFAQTNSIKKEGEVYKLIPDSDLKPMLYVMDIMTVNKYKRVDKQGTPWISLSEKNIPEIETYINNWDQIKKFLKIKKGGI